MKITVTHLAVLLFAPLAALHASRPILNSVSMTLVPIEPGAFTMGQDGPQTDYNTKSLGFLEY